MRRSKARPVPPAILSFARPALFLLYAAEAARGGTGPAAMTELDAPIFVGGVPRSGTTLVRVVLDSHSRIACGPELRATPHVCELCDMIERRIDPALAAAYGYTPDTVTASFARLMASLLRPGLQASGKARIAEKTPANGRWFGKLRQLFPDCHQVHVVRDGRDVVASLLGQDWRDGRTGQLFDYVQDARAAARLWATQIADARRAREEAGADGRFHELRYEDVVQDPRGTLQRLFDFLGEPWEERVLDFHRNARARDGQNETSAPQVSRPLYRESIGRWRSILTPGQIDDVYAVAGAELRTLGYDG